MQILIRWLHQKPSDQVLHCFLKTIYPDSTVQVLILIFGVVGRGGVWVRGQNVYLTNSFCEVTLDRMAYDMESSLIKCCTPLYVQCINKIAFVCIYVNFV